MDRDRPDAVRQMGKRTKKKLMATPIIITISTLPASVRKILFYEMIKAFTAGVMIFIEQFWARWPWSIGILEC